MNYNKSEQIVQDKNLSLTKYAEKTLQTQVNFQLTYLNKRTFLNQCITQLYILNSKADTIPDYPNPRAFDKSEICRFIDGKLKEIDRKDWRPSLESVRRRLFLETEQPQRKVLSPLERVKRRLFPETKPSKRKTSKPTKNYEQKLNFQYYYKTIRSIIGRQKVPRRYLSVVLNEASTTSKASVVSYNALADMPQQFWRPFVPVSLQQQYQRSPSLNQQVTETSSASSDGLDDNPQQLWRPFAPFSLEQEYQRSVTLTQGVAEEFIRSLFYLNTLLNLPPYPEEGS